MEKRREIIVDLHNVKNDNDIIYRFRKSLNLFAHAKEEEYQSRVEENNHIPVWASLFDDMSAIYFYDAPEIKKILLTISGMGDVAKNVSEETYILLIKMLSRLTDPANQIDFERGMDFLFRIRED